MSGETWARRELAGPQPPPVADRVTCFDRGREVLVITGGSNNAAGSGWEYNGQSWREVLGLALDISSVGGFMTFHSGLGAVVAVNRLGIVSVRQGDQWHPAPLGPPGTSPLDLFPDIGGCYSPETDTIVTVYRTSLGDPVSADLVVSGSSESGYSSRWVRRTGFFTPLLQGRPSLLHDPARGVLARYVHVTEGPKLSLVTPTGWTDLPAVGLPCSSLYSTTAPLRSAFVDRASGRLMIPGNGPDLKTGPGTWVLESGAWRELDPAARWFIDMNVGADPVRGQIVGVIGFRNCGTPYHPETHHQTWLWNGSRWLPAPAGSSPPARTAPSLAYSPATGELLFFGGYRRQNGSVTSPRDTWVWDGVSWNLRDNAGPEAFFRESLTAHDPITNSLLRVYAETSLTWSWSGSAWVPLVTAEGPWKITSLALDHQLGRVRAVGLSQVQGVGSRLLQWDGTRWVEDPFMAGRPWIFGGLIAQPEGSSIGVASMSGPSFFASLGGVLRVIETPTRPAESAFGRHIVLEPGTGRTLTFSGYRDFGQDARRAWAWNNALGAIVTQPPRVVSGGRIGLPMTLSAEVDPNGRQIRSVRWTSTGGWPNDGRVTGINTNTLTINPVLASDHLNYITFRVETECGEFTAGALSLFVLSCPGDIDLNGVIDSDDLIDLLGSFGQEAYGFDPDGSGRVDTPDLVYFLRRFGTACPPPTMP
ncbi:MAG: hypothetical protein ACKVZJ_08330 [Phycisphaerales bacterium]